MAGKNSVIISLHLAKLTASVTETTGIEPLKAISNISQLDVLYANGSITKKRKIISSMFPEKSTFDGFQYRSNSGNEAINLMCLDKQWIRGAKKNGTSPNFSDLSREVSPLVQNPNHLPQDLKLLADVLAA